MATIKSLSLLALTSLIMVGCMKTKEDGEPILSNYYREHSAEILIFKYWILVNIFVGIVAWLTKATAVSAKKVGKRSWKSW